MLAKVRKPNEAGAAQQVRPTYFGHLLGAQVVSQHSPILRAGLETISECIKKARIIFALLIYNIPVFRRYLAYIEVFSRSINAAYFS
ncbi:MAG: hypothetical protein GY718_02455 [Lentisphaerae bacterium]|nr:hypothetical protein [Lentisphaerota bacterium]